MTEQNTATASKQNNKANSFGGWGWSMIFMCMIAYFIGGGINTDGLNIFVGALSGARGWDRAAMLSWSTYGGWIAILFTYIFGHIIVKKGAKVVFVGTLFLTAIAIYFYGHTQNFAVYAISVAACSILSAGYSLTAPNTIQANWFPRKKGLALGWSTIGYPLCTMIFPFVTNFLMGNFGVESMFTAIAVFVPVSYTHLRHTAQRAHRMGQGYLCDGNILSDADWREKQAEAIDNQAVAGKIEQAYPQENRRCPAAAGLLPVHSQCFCTHPAKSMTVRSSARSGLSWFSAKICGRYLARR